MRLRRDRADARQRVELLQGGRVEVDAAARAGARRAARGAAAASPSFGTTICWPSATGAARLTSVERRLAGGAPGAAIASSTRLPSFRR